MNFYLKKGNPFKHDFSLFYDKKQAYDLSHVPISAQLKTGVEFTLICSFIVIKSLDNSNVFFLEADTASWPVGQHFFDIKFEFEFGSINSPTMFVTVEEAVTL